MKTIVVILIGLVMLFAVSALAGDDTVKVKPESPIKAVSTSSVETAKADQFVVYYLHMNRRCMTCGKLEAFSEEAVLTGFAEQLKDSSVVWRIRNFEEEGNEHFAKDYQLYNQSLIISKLHDGKEVEWKNLDMIWKLVRDKDKFIAYVQSEIKDFMKPAEKE